MADYVKKQFLDEAGLALYDAEIKKYIDSGSQNSQELIQGLASLYETLAGENTEQQAAIEANAAAIAANETAIGENKTAIETAQAAIDTLNGGADEEGSVAAQVKAAVDGIIDGAPELYDTLKEIAEWIGNDETGTANLIEKVNGNTEAIATLESDVDDKLAALKNYSDAQDKDVYDSIGSIGEISILNLFKEKVTVSTGSSVAAAIEEATEDQMLVLDTPVVTENLTITKPVTIDAKGATFTGDVVIADGVDVVIENAIFANPVKVEG